MDTAHDNAADRVPAGGAAPARLLCLARGLTHVFWGLAVMVGLLLGQATLDVFRVLRLPAYVAGAVFALGGFWRLHDAGALSARWLGRTRLAVWLSALTVYFAPFLVWWRARPFETVFFLNVVGLALAGMGVLLLAALLAGEVCRRFAAPGGRAEARVAAAGVVLLMMAPSAAGLVFAGVGALRAPAPFAQHAIRIAAGVPGWVAGVAVLPCALTLAVVWKARGLCYARLWHGPPGGSDGPPEPAGPWREGGAP